MKKILLTVFVVSIFISCDNSQDKRLTGRWQLQTAVYPTYEIERDSVFYSFDSGVFDLQTLRSQRINSDQAFGTYILKDDSIIMAVGQKYLVAVQCNKFYDWKTPERRFAIRTLNGKSLVISVNDTVYTFRKYY